MHVKLSVHQMVNTTFPKSICRESFLLYIHYMFLMKEKEWFCKKHPEFSSEGVCWKIIKPDLENEQIEKKYCQNKKQPDLIRRYERIGYVIIQPNDKCITKHCSICGQEALLNIDETKCCYCRYVY